MKKYEVFIYNKIGVIVLEKTIEADSENEAVRQVLENVDLIDGDNIQVNEKGE